MKTVILQGIPAVKWKSQKREAEDHPEVVVEHQTEGEVKVVQGGQGQVHFHGLVIFCVYT